MGISVFGSEYKEKHPIYVSKKCGEENHVDLLLTAVEGKKPMVLPKTLILLCMIILYIAEENIFVDIAYKHLVQKNY